MKRRYLDKPHFLVILGVLGASFSAIFVRLADAPSNVLVFYRLLIASVILIPLAVRELVRLKHRPQFRYLWLAAGSGLFLGLHFAAYFESLRLTSIASSVVLVDTEIFFVALAMYVILREKISRIGWLAIGVAFAGVLIIAFADAGQGDHALTGDLLALSGAACMAVYTIFGRICRRHLSTTLYTWVVYASGTLTILVILAIQQTPLFGYAPINLLAGLGLAVVCTLLGHSVFSWSLKYIQPSYVATVKLLEPVFATVLGLLIFIEIPPLQVILGGFVVIIGIFLLIKSPR